MNKVASKQDILMDSLILYYGDEANIQSLLNIIHNNNNISLRIIDWFVTNYSKKNDVHISGDNSHFIVHKDYKDQLKAFTKKQFDPFCRRERIQFFYKDEKFIRTTVGQLNFFRWAFSNNIIEYIRENHTDIEKDMICCLRNNYHKSSGKKEKKKRRELSQSASKSMNRYQMPITVSFD